MKETAALLTHIAHTTLPMLQTINHNEAAQPYAPGKWTRQQVLGHLIDSACNNQVKFVHTMAGDCSFTPYAQEHWVAIQRYDKASFAELVMLWYHYNLHMAHIIAHIPQAALQNNITIGGQTYTLAFIADDYVAHLQHHLKQILVR